MCHSIVTLCHGNKVINSCIKLKIVEMKSNKRRKCVGCCSPCDVLLPKIVTKHLMLVISSFLLVTTVSSQDITPEVDKPIPIFDVQGVIGKRAELPCDVTREGTLSMVLWFKDRDGEPLYSYDARRSQQGHPRHWSSERVFGQRAYFRTVTSPAKLLLDELRLGDEGVYRCRVDFHDAPTTNVRLNLTVIVPPDKPMILEVPRREEVNGIIGPHNEGSDLVLTCEVYGGRPRPQVTWWLESVLLDDKFELRHDGVVVNRLVFPSLGRQHLHSRLICQATNTNLSVPTTAAAILELNLKPLTVTILTKERYVSAEKTYDVECRAMGSRPPAIVTWWKGSRQMKKATEDKNSTLSILTFVPTIDDDGKYLTCRAENAAVPGSALEDKWRLNVLFTPSLSLRMGSNLNPEDIKEGDDVYFECHIRANPPVYKMAWFHDGRELRQNVSAGIILSNHSLVLQKVSRSSSGLYTCVAANAEGQGASNPVTLKVMFVPRCKHHSEELIGAMKQETVTIKCEVDADPPQVTFRWTFNHSSEVLHVPLARFTSDATVSSLNYTPGSELDYGTLACWGMNAVGKQQSPCVFQVVAAGRPFPPRNCSVVNQTADSLNVQCSEAFDGGLQQHFVLEVVDASTKKLTLNASAKVPIFAVHRLEPGSTYLLVIYAANAKGRSEPVELDGVTFRGVAKFTGSSENGTVNPIIGAFIGTALVLVAVILVVTVTMYRRLSRRRMRQNQKPETAKFNGERVKAEYHDLPLKGVTVSDGLLRGSTDDNDPDLIPNEQKSESNSIRGIFRMATKPPSSIPPQHRNNLIRTADDISSSQGYEDSEAANLLNQAKDNHITRDDNPSTSITNLHFVTSSSRVPEQRISHRPPATVVVPSGGATSPLQESCI